MLKKYLITLKNIVEENLSQEFKFKNIEKIKNYFIEEIDQNKLIGKKHKKVCPVLNYIEHLLISSSTVTGFTSISAFTFLVGVHIRITCSA